MKKLNINFLFLVFALLASTLMFNSCEQKTKGEKAKEDLEEAAESVGDVFRTEREEMQKDMEDLQEKINERLAALGKNLENASDDAKDGINKQIANLKSAKNDMDTRMKKLGDTIEDGWTEFKSDVRQSMDNIEKQLKDS